MIEYVSNEGLFSHIKVKLKKIVVTTCILRIMYTYSRVYISSTYERELVCIYIDIVTCEYMYIYLCMNVNIWIYLCRGHTWYGYLNRI